MPEKNRLDVSAARAQKISSRSRKQRRRIAAIGLSLVAIFVLAGSIIWLAGKAATIKTELTAAKNLVPIAVRQLSANEKSEAAATVGELEDHTRKARAAADDPIWRLTSSIPFLGPNVSAVSEVARSADDVTKLAVAPMVDVFDQLDWNTLVPTSAGSDLEPIKKARPSVAAAAHTVRASATRLGSIETDDLLPQVAEPLAQARDALDEVTAALDAAEDATVLAPEMLGDTGTKNYLLIIQNNAETRASGGIPGALAVLSLDKGKLELGAQSSATALGAFNPSISVDDSQTAIFSSRLGKYMQDVNLTPDFPTAANTAQLMWQKKTGQLVDGVISIDPIVLSYILQATGPVAVTGPELAAVKAAGLPSELTGSNVVPTLLSDVYAKIQQPKLQDAYFAGVAKEIFAALSNGRGDAQGLIGGMTRGTEEGRVLVWSADSSEQAVISKYALSGAISGPSVSPAQYGVYFNDGTGAKMDYYVKRTVQLVKECPADGYEQTKVRITSTNTAPLDAATSLPEYVTGGGAFGVSPGSVQTNIITYGPAQANVESVSVDGQKTPFAPYIHANRPVGIVAQKLAPGESKTVDFTFGKIVQHTEPNVVVTPTIQPVKDVILPPEKASCDQGQ